MRSFVGAFGIVALCATSAAAQEPRIFVNVNAGTQSQTQDFRQSAEFNLYDETGTWDAEHQIKSGNFFDIGGGFRLMRQFSVGLAYSAQTKQTREVTVNASVPSPLFFDTFRAASAVVPGLEHSEKALHLQALWHVPVTVEFDVTLFGGPTFFTVEDALVESIAVSEIGGDFSSVNLSAIGTSTQRNTTTGFNVGLDTRYMFLRNIGVGAMLRYSRGSIDLTLPSATATDDVKINTGGLEIGAGLRVRF